MKLSSLSQLNFRQWRWLWRAWWGLWLVQIRLRFGSSDWLVSMLARQEYPSQSAQHRVLAEQMHESVRLAARAHPLSVQCLPKSIVLHTLLRQWGVDSQLCVGVSKRPERGISSHAWVQLGGIAVCEPDSVTEQFTLVQTPV